MHTEAPSKADFEFEIARSYYNPNTKGNAYLDNFDNSQNITSMPISIYSWTKASPPVFGDDGSPDPTLDYKHQGLLIWHSSLTEQYDQIYGDAGNSYTNSREQTLLKLSLSPNDNLDGNSWGGIMRSLGQSLTNQSRMRTLDIVVQGQGGTLYADLGYISEDISILGLNQGAPDGILESEVNINSGDLVNRLDAGLDGHKDGQGESGGSWQCKPNCIWIPASQEQSDPAQDDWCAPTAGATDEPYCVDGTEGNNTGTQGKTFDTEDLDGSGALDTVNHYLRYPVPLDSACTAQFFCTTLANGWREYQIPLYGGGKIIDPSNTETEQSLLSNSKIMRLWLGHLPPGVAKTDVLLARVNLVGNTWTQDDQNTNYEIPSNRFGSGDLGDTSFVSVPPTVADSNTLRVDVLNSQQNPGYENKLSPTTPKEIDTRTNEPLPELALVMHYQNLHPGEAVGATRLLPNDVKDLTQYARLSLAVHSDSNWATNSPNYQPGENRVSFALQLGLDEGDGNSKDFYEIRLHMDTTAQLDPSQRSLWTQNSFSVNLSDLEGLKNDPIYRAFNGRMVSHHAYFAGRGDSSLKLSVVGNPNLGKINWMRLVVYVDSGANQKQQGEIWINDLNLEGVNRASGTAIRSQIQLDFSDFISVSGNLQYTNGNFTTLTQAMATPTNAKSTVDYNTNFSLYANKFMPDEWGVSMPISVQYRGALDRPFTIPSSDVTLQGTDLSDMTGDLLGGHLSSIHNPADSLKDVDDRNARVYQSLTSEEQFSVSYHKDMRSKNWLTQALLERPDFQYHYDGSEHSEYYQEADSRSYQFRLTYNLSPTTDPSYKPFSFADKWKYMPGAVSGLQVTPLPDKFNLVLADYSFVRSFILNKPHNVFDQIDTVPVQYTVDLSHGVDLEWKPLSFFDFGYRLDVVRDLDPDHACVDGDNILSSSNPCGPFAANMLFAWDRSDPKTGKYQQQNGSGIPVTVDTTHYGNEYGILALERNRTQSFHSDLNLNPLQWLTLGAFNSGLTSTRGPTARPTASAPAWWNPPTSRPTPTMTCASPAGSTPPRSWGRSRPSSRSWTPTGCAPWT